MVTFILPGYSLHNKEWAEETAKNLKLNGEIRPVFWNHWEDSSKKFDPEEKVRLIVDVARSNAINIIAKSIGTLIASHIMQRVPERIERIVFCGIPINDLDEKDKEVYRQTLKEFPADKIICFQNEDDPHGTFAQISDFLAKINGEIKVIKKLREDHEYPYFDEFQVFLSGLKD